MPALSGNRPITLFNIGSLVTSGGDPNATIPLGTLDSPSTRGMHLLAAYVAPLDSYHDTWTNRTKDAIQGALDDWRDVTALTEQTDYVQDALVAGQNNTQIAQQSAIAAHLSWQQSVHGAPLAGHDLRSHLNTALATVDAYSVAMRVGSDLYRTDVVDLNRLTDTGIKLDADQGMASARTIGDAVQFASQVQRVQDAKYGLIEGEAELKAKQKLDSQSNDDSGFLGNVIGFVGGLFS